MYYNFIYQTLNCFDSFKSHIPTYKIMKIFSSLKSYVSAYVIMNYLRVKNIKLKMFPVWHLVYNERI